MPCFFQDRVVRTCQPETAGTSFLFCAARLWQQRRACCRGLGTALAGVRPGGVRDAISATGAILVRRGLRANRRPPTKSKQEVRPSYIHASAMTPQQRAIAAASSASGSTQLRRASTEVSKGKHHSAQRAGEPACAQPRAPDRRARTAPKAQPQLLRAVRRCSVPYRTDVISSLCARPVRGSLRADAAIRRRWMRRRCRCGLPCRTGARGAPTRPLIQIDFRARGGAGRAAHP